MTGKGNYTGKATGSFSITAMPKVDISGATASAGDHASAPRVVASNFGFVGKNGKSVNRTVRDGRFASCAPHGRRVAARHQQVKGHVRIARAARGHLRPSRKSEEAWDAPASMAYKHV